jgi:hypothetical protein
LISSPPVTQAAGRQTLMTGLLIAVSLAMLGLGVSALFGGQVSVPALPFRLSVRNPRNPLVIGVLAGALVVWRDPGGCAGIGTRLRILLHVRSVVLTLLATALVLAAAVRYGSFVAGGADSSGYLSQARQWRSLAFSLPIPLAESVAWPGKAEALSPLGHRPAPGGRTFVTLYPPGYPMLMAAAQAVAGERAAFAVVPLCAAGTVFLVFLIGRQLAGPAAGLLAAALLACSPIFLFQAFQPMSDVPATFWWVLAFYLLMARSPVAALFAGLAAGLASLVRPNLWVLAAAAIPLAAWWRLPGQSAGRRVLLFASGLAAGATIFLWWQEAIYGSVLQASYGPRVDEMLNLEWVWPNLQRYPRWLVQLHSPIVALALAAPAILWFAPAGPNGSRHASVRCAICALAFFALLQGFYLAYEVFDSWPFLRFLLPALALLLVLVAVVVSYAVSKLWAPVRVFAGWLVVVTIVSFGLRTSATAGVFAMADLSRRFERAAATVTSSTPDGTVVFSMLHSGSVAYYTGRPIVRWDIVPPGLLGAYARDLDSLGRPSILLVDDLEAAEFDARHGAELTPFRATAALTLADAPPGVRYYDVSRLARAAEPGQSR